MPYSVAEEGGEKKVSQPIGDPVGGQVASMKLDPNALYISPPPFNHTTSKFKMCISDLMDYMYARPHT